MRMSRDFKEEFPRLRYEGGGREGVDFGVS